MKIWRQAVGIAVGGIIIFWVLQAILARWLNFQFNTAPVATFLEIYGITFAFTLYVVWSQFNSVQNGVKQEADVLEDIY